MKFKSAALKIKDFDLHVKSVGDDGTFTGYGSIFGNIDSYNEVVAKGAFVDSLKAIQAKGRPVPVLWQHRSGQPIGVYESLSEDDTGLLVKGRLLKDEVAQAAEAWALMKAGAVSGLSIGYYVRDDSMDEKTRVRTLKAVDLIEVSLVTFPANDEARVDAIKSKLAHGSLPTLPEFEQLLREAGFSKTQSAVIANRGLAHMLRSESEGGTADMKHAQALHEQLRGFSLPQL